MFRNTGTGKSVFDLFIITKNSFGGTGWQHIVRSGDAAKDTTLASGYFYYPLNFNSAARQPHTLRIVATGRTGKVTLDGKDLTSITLQNPNTDNNWITPIFGYFASTVAAGQSLEYSNFVVRCP